MGTHITGRDDRLASTARDGRVVETSASRVSPDLGRLDAGSARGDNASMKTVSIQEAKNRLTELAHTVERGETIVVTRNGAAVFDMTPHRPKNGLRFEAIEEIKREFGTDSLVEFIADDFDDPLPEDFLLRPLPPGA